MRRRDLLRLSAGAALVPLGGGAWAAPGVDTAEDLKTVAALLAPQLREVSP